MQLIATCLLLFFIIAGSDGRLIRGLETENERNTVKMTPNDLAEPENQISLRGICDVNYEKIGCFQDEPDQRALSQELFQDLLTGLPNYSGQSVDFNDFSTYLPGLVCRCAQKSKQEGFSYFGLQNYGICFSGPQAASSYNMYGSSKYCFKHVEYGNMELCDVNATEECVGHYGVNFVYQIMEDPCTNNTCLNGATCTVTGDDSYSCQCAEGYHGNSCEKVNCNISACPEGWVLREKSCFLVIDIPTLKWTDARRTCQNLGGDLAIIRSADENSFIFELMKKQKTVTAWGAWLGLYRKADNEFYWVDDSSLAGQYSAWASGEPSSVAEICTHIYGAGSNQGKWNDLTCVKNKSNVQYSPVVLCQKKSN
ncbi:hypothetical protein ACROYT_G041123 [Oculina patagonica]